MRNKQKLPPLVRGFQIDDYLCDQWCDPMFCATLAEAVETTANCEGIVVVRNTRTGKIVYRNKAARAAGIGGSR